jgi:hypothetical protein
VTFATTEELANYTRSQKYGATEFLDLGVCEKTLQFNSIVSKCAASGDFLGGLQDILAWGTAVHPCMYRALQNAPLKYGRPTLVVTDMLTSFVGSDFANFLGVPYMVRVLFSVSYILMSLTF